MFSKSDYVDDADSFSFMYGIGGYFSVGDRNSFSYGYSYSDSKGNHNSSDSTANETNSISHGYTLGHDFIINQLMSTSIVTQMLKLMQEMIMKLMKLILGLALLFHGPIFL